jgi:glycosyltransferase involved in cell wall biosynthesis
MLSLPIAEPFLARAPKVAFIGSYPPRECGIATFTKDVVSSFAALTGSPHWVIAIDERPDLMRVYPPEVVARIVRDEPATYALAADAIATLAPDIVHIQHEYGLFGGEDGERIFDLLDRVHAPVVVSLHTVLPDPSEHHRLTARRLCARADAVIVLSEAGKEILETEYGIDHKKLRVIPHGVPDVPFESTEGPKRALGLAGRTLISTFGLINRGKGLEYAIEALRAVVPTHPNVLYLILGETHPEVRRNEGEVYRESLQERIRAYGLERHVRLLDRYLGFDELIGYLRATDIYLTPYVNPVQIVSGTLAYAVGCGKAVVSTPYLYAKELLADGRGLLSAFRDGDSIATQLLALLDVPVLRRTISQRAYEFGRSMTWSHVSLQHLLLFRELAPIHLTKRSA